MISVHSQICAVLYPGDATEDGKLLRLKQQFFLCSASLQVGYLPLISFLTSVSWPHFVKFYVRFNF